MKIIILTVRNLMVELELKSEPHELCYRISDLTIADTEIYCRCDKKKARTRQIPSRSRGNENRHKFAACANLGVQVMA